MYDSDYLCPVCYGKLKSFCGELWCDNCEDAFEPWECANTLKVIMEDFREQEAINRFYGLEN